MLLLSHSTDAVSIKMFLVSFFVIFSQQIIFKFAVFRTTINVQTAANDRCHWVSPMVCDVATFYGGSRNGFLFFLSKFWSSNNTYIQKYIQRRAFPHTHACTHTHIYKSNVTLEICHKVTLIYQPGYGH